MYVVHIYEYLTCAQVKLLSVNIHIDHHLLHCYCHCHCHTRHFYQHTVHTTPNFFPVHVHFYILLPYLFYFGFDGMF